MTMTDITETLSLGQQLKTAREALNLSIIDVAEKTNLKKAHLEAIEDDIFILPNVPPTFVRGYVRNYVRFLRLPETLVGTVNYGEVTIPKEVKRTVTAPIPVKNNQKSQTRWVKGLTWLILLAAIGMTLAWWWQEHKKDQASSEQMVSNAVEISPSNSEPVKGADNLSSVPVLLESQKNTPTQIVVETAQAVDSVTSTVQAPKTDSAQQATVPAVTVPTVSTSEVQQPTVQVAENTSATAQPAQNETVTQQDKQAETPVEPVNVLRQTAIDTPAQTAEPQNAESSQEQAVNNDELRIEITNATSWITVRGVKNKKLAEKLYNAGDVLTFNRNEQYRLTIGAPANVKIYYKGQPVPLKVDGRVARFKLPLAK